MQGWVRERGVGIVREIERLRGEVDLARQAMVQGRQPYHGASLLHRRVHRHHLGLLRLQAQQPSEQRFLLR